MPEFRIASGLVSCTPFLRTASGLIDATALFFGEEGPVDSGGGDALNVALSSVYVAGARSANGAAIISTNTVTATATGGKTPYNFAWSGPSGFQIRSPAAATTNFSSSVPQGETEEADFDVTVTDARGAQKIATVSASFTNYGGGQIA